MGAKFDFLGRIIYAFCIVASFVSTVIVGFDVSQPEYYDKLFLIPFIFGIVSCFSKSIYGNIPNNVGVTFIILLEFYRSVLIPIFMAYGNYESLLKLNIGENIDAAIALMLYEIVIVFLFIRIALQRKLFCHRVVLKHSKRYFKWILFGLCCFDFVVWILIPEVREDYRSMFSMFSDEFTLVMYDNADNAIGSLKRILITLFSITFGVVRILLPAYCMILIARKLRNYPKLGILLSLSFIFMQLFFVTSTIAYTLICCLLLLIFLAYLWKRYARCLMVGSVLGVVIFITFFFVGRFLGGYTSTDSNSLVGFWTSVQIAYFAGIDNIAAFFNVSEQGKWIALLMDCVHCIPFNSTLFGLSHLESSQSIYNIGNASMGQIPPSTGLGFYYFGGLLAPIFSACLAYLGTRMGMKATIEKQPLIYLAYVYCALFAAMGISMYNFFIAMSWIISVFIPLYYMGRLYYDKTL